MRRCSSCGLCLLLSSPNQKALHYLGKVDLAAVTPIRHSSYNVRTMEHAATSPVHQPEQRVSCVSDDLCHHCCRCPAVPREKHKQLLYHHLRNEVSPRGRSCAGIVETLCTECSPDQIKALYCLCYFVPVQVSSDVLENDAKLLGRRHLF